MIRWITYAACALVFALLLAPIDSSSESSSNKGRVPGDEPRNIDFAFTGQGPEANDIHIKWKQNVHVREAKGYQPGDHPPGEGGETEEKGKTWRVGPGENDTTEMTLTLSKTKKEEPNLQAGGNLRLKIDPLEGEVWDLVESYQWTLDRNLIGEEKKLSSTRGSGGVGAAKVATANGLRTVTFETIQGRVIVNLPDDMRAGDTISGTVVAEPKGQTDEERKRNMSPMGDRKIKIATAKKPDGTSDVNVEIPITATLGPFTFKLPPIGTPSPPLANVSSSSSGGFGITLTNTGGSLSTGSTQTIPIEIVSLSLQSVAPLTVHQFPTMGQQGRPIVITGPFDGNSSNTGLSYRPCVRSVDCAGTSSAWVASGELIVAESPRQAIFMAPTNVTGPMEIRVNEGTTETKAPFRNVGIKLTAPTTTLPKGGSTVVTGEATGVGGSQQPIPIHVACTGQVDMQGGNSQTLQAPPSSDPNAKFVFNLPITATKGPGPFSVTATVVVFNVCLQDDSNGNQISINSTTGDYRFCNVFPTVVAGDSGRVDVVWYGTTTPETGAVTKAGCIITLQHNAKDGRVQAQTDRCTQTGSATVQPAPGKTRFTITDRNTTNNTCTCK